jgi:GNAT superfamily N-acetyltransferase
LRPQRLAEATFMTDRPFRIQRRREFNDRDVAALADVLIDCVHAGASIGFMAPLSRQRAESFWRAVAADVHQARRAILVAEDPHGICGTVQLITSMPDNQPHRADVCKMLVHSRARRQGLGAALMLEAEQLASELHKTLLVLDTVTDSDAHRLYRRLGWSPVGDIPGYALFPDGSPCSTTYFYKQIPSVRH